MRTFPAALATAALLAISACAHQNTAQSPSAPAISTPPTQNVTPSAPQPTPGSPSTPPSGTPAPPSSAPAQDPALVVERFYAAINAHDYQTAWSLGGDHLGGSYSMFAAGFADTATDVISIDSVQGDTVNVHLHAVHTDGSTADYTGSYTVTNATIAGGTLHLVGAPAPAAPGGPTVPSSALNPAVTQATIRMTICVAGWTATIRPPTAFTDALKKQELAASGKADQNPSHYEEDHMVPLELGGAPNDPANLRPVPLARAHTDDALETSLNHQVCNGSITLTSAQQQILLAKAGEG